jgi:uncharacterized protein YjbJ (UPF0337 family)
MKSSTHDKMAGAAKSAAGKMKEKIGHATRNPNLQDEGTMQKAEGKAQSKMGDVKKVFDR